MGKNIFKFKLSEVNDITSRTFYQNFLDKERNSRRNGETIYIVASKVSFNTISQIAWDINKLKNNLRLVVIFNEPHDVEKIITEFMNNIHEGYLSAGGLYPQNAIALKGMVDAGQLEFLIAKEKYHLCVINGYTTLMGIDELRINKSFSNGYVFWEDYEDYAAEIKSEIEIIYRNSDEATEIYKLLEFLKKDYTTEELYYLMLLNIFQVQEYTREKREINSLPMGQKGLWKNLFSFQKDGVYGLIHRLNKNGFALLADSVGLGKTYQALAVSQYYQERKSERTLILSPVKLFENWDNETSSSSVKSFKDVSLTFDVHYHTTITSKRTPQQKSVDTFNYAQYDLLIVDEAHAFRNNKSKRFIETFNKILNANPHIKVLLLTATPVNNSLKDLESLIFLMSKGSKKIDVQGEKVDYKSIISQASKSIQSNHEVSSNFYEMLDEIQVSRDKAYIKEVYKNTSLKFPQKNPVISLSTKLEENETYLIRRFYEDITQMDYASYNYFDYLREERKEYFKKKLGKNISERSQGMKYLMRLLLLKRYESTFNSLTKTIENMISQMKKWEEIGNTKSEQFQINITVNDSKEILKTGEEDVEAIDIFDLPVIREDFKPEFFEAIKSDISILEAISSNLVYKAISNKKIDKLIHEVEKILKRGEKVIIFTSYSDTAKELSDKLRNINHGLVTGSDQCICFNSISNYKNNYDDILKEFSPLSKGNEKVKNKIDVLIATDVISEGQNLQDCSNIINFDVHWNPVRIIQRLGRIDRLNSQHKKIDNFIFWPMDSLEDYLEMKKRIDTKNQYIEAVGAEGYEIESKFSTTKDQLEKVAKGIDIEDNIIKAKGARQEIKKFEIDYKRIKEEIDEESTFYEIVDYLHSIRGLSGYVYANDISKSCYLLYRVSSKNKFKSELYPYILIELDNNLKIKSNQLDSLKIVKKLYTKSLLHDFSSVNKYNKKEFFKEELKYKLKEIIRYIIKNFEGVNENELSLVCGIYSIPSVISAYEQDFFDNNLPILTPEEIDQQLYLGEYEEENKNISQVYISSEKANNFFD